MSNQQELIKPFFLLLFASKVFASELFFSLLLKFYAWASSSSSLIFYFFFASRPHHTWTRFISFSPLFCLCTANKKVSNFIIYFYIHNLFWLQEGGDRSNSSGSSRCLPRPRRACATSHISHSEFDFSSNGQSDGHRTRVWAYTYTLTSSQQKSKAISRTINLHFNDEASSFS